MFNEKKLIAQSLLPLLENNSLTFTIPSILDNWVLKEVKDSTSNKINTIMIFIIFTITFHFL